MEQDKVIPLDTQRRLVAYQTAKSWEEVPHVAYLYEPDATELYQAYLRRREELSGQGRRLTLNTLLLKAVAEGLKAAPCWRSCRPRCSQRGFRPFRKSPAFTRTSGGRRPSGSAGIFPCAWPLTTG